MGALLRWQREFFLREEEWRFRLPQGYETFAEKFTAATEPRSKSWFNSPLIKWGSKHSLFGYCDPDTVIIKARGRKSTLYESVGLSLGHHFKGEFRSNKTGLFLIGRYRALPWNRAIFLGILNLVFLGGVLGLVFGGYEIVRTQEPRALVMTIINLALVFIVLAFFYLILWVQVFLDRPFRDQIYKILADITGDAGQISSRRGEVPGRGAGPGLRLL